MSAIFFYLTCTTGKRYFQQTKLADIIDAYPCKSGLSDAEQADQRIAREAFFDFLSGVLVSDPLACRMAI